MDFEEFRARLTRGFAAPLPGAAAQGLLAPRPRTGWQPGRIPDGCRVGAGLILGYPSGGRATVVLTLRAAGLNQHAGQVSLPGGAVDAAETIDQAALREGREEIGIDPSEVELHGRLTPLHIPASGFVLHPVVATLARRPVFVAQPGEVERVIEADVACLGEPGTLQVETREFRGRRYAVPYLPVDGAKLWGATAMVLAELLSLLGRAPRRSD